MRDWLWHLLNDPMRENPWATGLLVAVVFGSMGAAIGPTWWRTRRGSNAKDS